MSIRISHRRVTAPAVLAVACCAVLAGCGSAVQTTELAPGFVPAKTYSVSLGEITDVSPPYPEDEKVDLEPVQALKAGLTQKLAEHQVSMAPGSADAHYILAPEIREYRPGSAFKRWLLPGHGPTILSVESDLREGDASIAKISTRRTVDAGGAYTAGAYESIFDDVAEDIVVDLKAKLSGQ